MNGIQKLILLGRGKNFLIVYFSLTVNSNLFLRNSADKMDDEKYVLEKLNASFFHKLQTFGGERGKEKEENTTQGPLNRSKSVKARRRSSVIGLDESEKIKITKPKRRNSSIQDERSIHDAYHTLLNEYNRVGYVISANRIDIKSQ